MKNLLIITFLSFFIASCANESGARIGISSATAPVIAILHNDLFLGETTGYSDRTGTIKIQSSVNPDIHCIGEFRYTGSHTGVATLRCNDGNIATVFFNSLTLLSGYGIGDSNRGPVSFTYGLTLEQASKYLVLPKGKELKKQNGKAILQAI